nr:hypothetical protein CFP56_07868 [Quercus suber]
MNWRSDFTPPDLSNERIVMRHTRATVCRSIANPGKDSSSQNESKRDAVSFMQTPGKCFNLLTPRNKQLMHSHPSPRAPGGVPGLSACTLPGHDPKVRQPRHSVGRHCEKKSASRFQNLPQISLLARKPPTRAKMTTTKLCEDLLVRLSEQTLDTQQHAASVEDRAPCALLTLAAGL